MLNSAPPAMSSPAPLDALLLAMEAKDPCYLAGHCRRVAVIARALASEIGLPRAAQNACYLGGLAHDLGKVGIADHILNKAGPLSSQEWTVIKSHPALAYSILMPLRGTNCITSDVHDGVLSHHEAWDGSGYPNQLSGRSIPFVGRILAVADALDAMSTTRSYQDARSTEEICQIFCKGRAVQWQASLVDAVLPLVECYDELVQHERNDQPVSAGRHNPSRPFTGSSSLLPTKATPLSSKYYSPTPSRKGVPK